MRELVAKRVAVFRGGEVAALASPLRHRADDAADELAHRRLPILRPHMSSEILRDDDVRGHLRPELRHLDVLLLEDDLAALVRDHCRAQIPFAGVEHVDAWLGEEALDGDAAGAGLLASGTGWAGRVRAGSKGRGNFHGRHDLSPPHQNKGAPHGGASSICCRDLSALTSAAWVPAPAAPANSLSP